MTLKFINTYLFKINSFVPVISITILYLFLISTIIDLGYFPLPSADDPKSNGLQFLNYASGYGFLIMIFSSIFWLINFIIEIYLNQVSKKHVLIFVIGLILFSIQIIFDPGNIFYWYFD